jgi:hypothetical protein
MDVPRPAVPSERLDGWRETDATIEQAFSTPIVTVYTHTVVFEETTVRTKIKTNTGYDHPWQFFFSSRIRLDPQRDPGTMLTKLVRRKAAAGFTDRLADRGIEQVTERDRGEQQIGDALGLVVSYRGVVRRSISPADSSAGATGADDANTGDPDDTSALLSLPVTAVMAVWAADGDYHVAGGGVPAGAPDSGPPAVVDAVAKAIDPTAARQRLGTLIDACGRASASSE